jgi:hypothetical protein
MVDSIKTSSQGTKPRIHGLGTATDPCTLQAFVHVAPVVAQLYPHRMSRTSLRTRGPGLGDNLIEGGGPSPLLISRRKYNDFIRDVAGRVNGKVAMKRTKRFKVLWTIWMAGGGIAIAVIVFVVTASVVWAIIGLLGSSVVLNMIGQAVTQPMNAARGANRKARTSAGPVR